MSSTTHKLSRKLYDRKHTITRLTRTASNTNKNIVGDNNTNNYTKKYILRIYSLNGFRIKVYDSHYIVKIRIGTQYEECITLTITKEIKEIKETKDYNQLKHNAELEIFNYQSGCNIIEDMERNKGTKNMMKTIIQFIKQKYPSVREIYLLDASMYKCDKLAIYKNAFSLYDYYLFKYGSTYYEHNFGAEMVSQSDKELHEVNKKVIKDFKINKILFEKYLSKQIGKIPVPSIKEDIKQFIDAINDNELATNFIKRYRFSTNTCYLMHFLFEFCKKVINIMATTKKTFDNDNDVIVIDIETYETLYPYCMIMI